MYENQRKDFAGVWSFDGHGLNRDGQRVAKMSECGTIPQYLDGNKRNPEFDNIGEGLAEMCNAVAKGVSILDETNDLSRVLFELNLSTLERCDYPATLAVVVVKRPDGKSARFSLTIGASRGRPYCELTALRPNSQTDKSVTGSFV